MRKAITLAIVAVLSSSLGMATEAVAKQCRDAKGKFTKCEEAAAPTRCRDVKTKKFAKCGTSGTEAIP